METQAVEQQEILDIPTPEPAAGHRTGRILVAEDDVHMRRLIAATLRTAGYRVVEASDGAEVLERVESTIWHDRHGLFGAIVADMNMPALTGLDVLAALRCAEIDTPFILVTAFGDEGVRAEAKWLGATAVLDKPFGLDDLRSSVRSALCTDPRSISGRGADASMGRSVTRARVVPRPAKPARQAKYALRIGGPDDPRALVPPLKS